MVCKTVPPASPGARPWNPSSTDSRSRPSDMQNPARMSGVFFYPSVSGGGGLEDRRHGVRIAVLGEIAVERGLQLGDGRNAHEGVAICLRTGDALEVPGQMLAEAHQVAAIQLRVEHRVLPHDGRAF